MTEFIPPLASDRDGTSQAQRPLPALQTDYVGIDEHNLQDQLAFAHAFAKELNYFNADNVKEGDWRKLFNPEDLKGTDFAAWLQQIEDFVKQPENFADARFYNLHRPHFVLFLTFLQLLGNTQAQLNQLTARHLDFYYQQVLNFKKMPPQSDRVNVLVGLSKQADSALLPKGSLLSAGKDSLGKELVYSTDSDLVVNSAKIARLSSVYVNKQVIGIREARERYPGTKDDAVMEMLKIALGDPLPGDALPAYPPLNTPVDFSFLTQLQTGVQFVKSGLYLELAELRSLMRLKNNRGVAADGDWVTINQILTKFGKTRAGESFKLSADPRDFDANIKAALGFSSLADYFSTLTLVKNFTELYEQRTRQDVKDFMAAKQLDVESFNEMMRIKVRIDNEWGEINLLLERAGLRRSVDYQRNFPEPPDFAKNFALAIGSPKYPNVPGKINDLDSFYDALLKIEAYFFMALEDFAVLMDAANADPGNGSQASAMVWEDIYRKLAQAHQKKTYVAHKAELNKLRQGHVAPDAQKLAAEAMMQMALGLPATDNSDLLNRVKELLPTGTDASLLEQAAAGDKLTETDWDSVCNTLELAWRNRVPMPVAQKTNWLSLNACGDTLSAKVPDNSDASRWYTFGQRQTELLTDKNQPPSAALGWAISSPMLCLEEGQRTLTLTLIFNAGQFNDGKIAGLLANKDSQPFSIELSTAKGWITATNASAEMDDYPADIAGKALKKIAWTLDFDQSVAAISALPDSEGGFINSSWPVLRLLLQPRLDAVTKTYVTDYPLFQGLLLEKVQLDVAVNGLNGLLLQNDNNALPPGKPFEPFGSSPAIGARLYFGHPELSFKQLKKLDINLQWMGVPNAKLEDHYKNYSVAVTNKTIKSKIALVDQRLELILDDAALFAEDARNPASLSVDNVEAKIKAGSPGYLYQRQLAAESDAELDAWQRYWFLELSGCDFQHAAYPGVASAKSIELATAAITRNTEISADNYKVNPPYTPKLKSLGVNYSSTMELTLADLQSETADQVYHLHPFGYAAIQADSESGGYSFLPAYNNEGELYIGLENVQAPQMLSMLLQMAEGSANPDLEPAAVEWSRLDNNRWLPLSNGQLQADASNGLLQSGIIQLQLDESCTSTLLPSGLYWLRAAIAERVDSVCDTIGIDTQAVSATFADRGNAEDHLKQPLPINTIQKLVDPIAGIAVISQPYTSFGAKLGEQDSHFSTRISERLRHKQRALSLWDYERLVLGQFPEIYKVKAIPAGMQENLGLVTVVVIPDIRKRLPFNPFAPKAPANLLDDIGEFLTTRLPLGARIKVKNACFLPVKLRFAVRFMPDYDSGFYKQQLNGEVNHFLSPWAYEQGKDLVIGGKIYANAIIDFIERRPYVDYVAHFKLFLGDETGHEFQLARQTPGEGYFVAAHRPDAVLVAAKNHDIDLIADVNSGEQIFNGINYMKLELDFIVG